MTIKAAKQGLTSSHSNPEESTPFHLKPVMSLASKKKRVSGIKKIPSPYKSTESLGVSEIPAELDVEGKKFLDFRVYNCSSADLTS